VDEDAEKPKDEALPKKAKGKSGRLILILGAVLATGTSAAAGAVIGPALARKGQTAPSPAASAASAEHGADEPPGEVAALDPIIVDVREANGDAHHLKVGIAVELGHGTGEEEWKRLVPRIRDSAISYLRSLSFDEVSSAAKFDSIRSELGERISHAAGKGRVRRVMFTDFVAQ